MSKKVRDVSNLAPFFGKREGTLGLAFQRSPTQIELGGQVHSRTAQMTDGYLRLPTVIERTGLPRSSLYRLIEEGRFPRQVPLTRRTVGWKASAVQQWLDDPAGYRSDQ